VQRWHDVVVCVESLEVADRGARFVDVGCDCCIIGALRDGVKGRCSGVSVVALQVCCVLWWDFGSGLAGGLERAEEDGWIVVGLVLGVGRGGQRDAG
jgi:hypothetical protein